MRFLFDTDHFSIRKRKAAREYALLQQRMSAYSRSEFAVSIVSFQEQAVGCHDYIKRARRRHELLKGYELLMDILADFRSCPVLPFAAAEGATFDHLGRAGVRIGTMDLRIAEITISNGLILLTRNTNDFSRVPGLACEDWTLP